MIGKIAVVYNRTKNIIDSEEVRKIVEEEGLLEHREEILDAWEILGDEGDEEKFIKDISASLFYMAEHIKIEAPEVFRGLDSMEANAYKILKLLGLEAEAKAVVSAVEGRNTRAYELGY